MANPTAHPRQYKATVTAPWRTAEAFADALEEAAAPQALAVSLWEEAEDRWLVEGYYDHAPDPDALARLLADTAARLGVPAPAPEIEEIVPRDWIAASLAELHPVIAGRFFVHGAHDRDRRPSGAGSIEIDAAQAFGTGHHATTSCCLIALTDLAKRHRPRRVLDLGCGTGVLAIAAARLTRRPVLATDIDPVATSTARANARLNGVGALVATVTATGLAHPLIARAAPFDLIMANILAGPLVALAPAIARATKSGGHVILSGLLTGQERRVTAAYVGQGFRVVRRLRLSGWSTLVLGRRRQARPSHTR
jgi:ribosomal protein L11 methyltransferase